MVHRNISVLFRAQISGSIWPVSMCSGLSCIYLEKGWWWSVNFFHVLFIAGIVWRRSKEIIYLLLKNDCATATKKLSLLLFNAIIWCENMTQLLPSAMSQWPMKCRASVYRCVTGSRALGVGLSVCILYIYMLGVWKDPGERRRGGGACIFSAMALCNGRCCQAVGGYFQSFFQLLSSFRWHGFMSGAENDVNRWYQFTRNLTGLRAPVNRSRSGPAGGIWSLE